MEEEKQQKESSTKKTQETPENIDLGKTLESLDQILEEDRFFEEGEQALQETSDEDRPAVLEALVKKSGIRQRQQTFELVSKELEEALRDDSGDISRLESELFELAEKLISLTEIFEQFISSFFTEDEKIAELKTKEQILELVIGVYKKAGKEVPEERLVEIK